MEIKQYQEELKDTVTYGNSHRIIYPTLALNQTSHNLGESIRNIYQNRDKEITSEIKIDIREKISECLWCLVALANDLDIDLDLVAQDNLKGSKEIYSTFISNN